MSAAARIRAGEIKDLMNGAHDRLLAVIADPGESTARRLIDALRQLEQEARVSREIARDGLAAPKELGEPGQAAGKDVARLAAAARRDTETILAKGTTADARRWRSLLRDHMGATTPWAALVGRLG